MPIVDALIIGSGVAGLTAGIKIAQRFPNRKICILTKDIFDESNTRYAQGGIAAVSDLKNDSFEGHIRDTCHAGDGLCDPVVVERTISEAPARLQELMDIGVAFDRNLKGELNLGREGGHHANRIVHCQDVTGLKLSTALIEKAKSLPNLRLLSYHVAIDLITSEGLPFSNYHRKKCQGAYVLDVQNNKVEKYSAAVTVLATGGLGQLYRVTTNPLIATGDGIAMAFRAGAKISNMEFIQFHPTALVDPGRNPVFLVSEAVRGYGAHLRNEEGERFLFHYHEDGELACRDIVARAIATELQNGSTVYLDCRHIVKDFEVHFPTIYKTCLSNGIQLKSDLIPVAPAAHYLCGGIDVDIHGRTSIQNLYACGECSHTGLHGANRLASNSLLEALVYAHACYLDVERSLEAIQLRTEEGESLNATELFYALPDVDLSETRLALQHMMSAYAGIVRCKEGLLHALHELTVITDKVECNHNVFYYSPLWSELKNMITCAKLIVEQSLSRTENKGVFFNRDLHVSLQ